MVRINLIKPKNLSDQHLIAEYNEILILLGQVKKYPKIKEQPKHYCLGKGHINFFKNKLAYLKSRHEAIKKEMKKRGFKTKKNVKLSGLPKRLQKNWRPRKEDKEIIKKRLKQRIRLKPSFYKYYKKKRTKKFLLNLIDSA